MIENALTPVVLEVENIIPIARGSNCFGSTDIDTEDTEAVEDPPTDEQSENDPHISPPRRPPDVLTISAVEKE